MLSFMHYRIEKYVYNISNKQQTRWETIVYNLEWISVYYLRNVCLCEWSWVLYLLANQIFSRLTIDLSFVYFVCLIHLANTMIEYFSWILSKRANEEATITIDKNKTKKRKEIKLNWTELNWTERNHNTIK